MTSPTLAEPLEDRATVPPELVRRLLLLSAKVTVTVDFAVPSANTEVGDAVNVVFALVGSAGPGVKVTSSDVTFKDPPVKESL